MSELFLLLDQLCGLPGSFRLFTELCIINPTAPAATAATAACRPPTLSTLHAPPVHSSTRPPRPCRPDHSYLYSHTSPVLFLRCLPSLTRPSLTSPHLTPFFASPCWDHIASVAAVSRKQGCIHWPPRPPSRIFGPLLSTRLLACPPLRCSPGLQLQLPLPRPWSRPRSVPIATLTSLRLAPLACSQLPFTISVRPPHRRPHARATPPPSDALRPPPATPRLPLLRLETRHQARSFGPPDAAPHPPNAQRLRRVCSPPPSDPSRPAWLRCQGCLVALCPGCGPSVRLPAARHWQLKSIHGPEEP
jgi:hypothetical protein